MSVLGSLFLRPKKLHGRGGDDLIRRLLLITLWGVDDPTEAGNFDVYANGIDEMFAAQVRGS